MFSQQMTILKIVKLAEKFFDAIVTLFKPDRLKIIFFVEGRIIIRKDAP